MDVRIAIPEEQVTAPVLNAGLEAVTRLNEQLIQEGQSPTFTEAVKQGVRWRAEPPGLESFDHGGKVIGRGWGDCDDLAPLRAASLRVSGEDKLATAVVYRSGPGRWHAIVQRSTGPSDYEDPSQTAGMKVRQGGTGIPPAVVGAMFSVRGVNGSMRPGVSVRQAGCGWEGRCDVPIGETPYSLSTTQRAARPAYALAGAIQGACSLAGVADLADDDDLGKLWALSGLLKGASAREVADVMGVDVTKEAVSALFGIAPKMGDRRAARPFDARAAVVGADFGAAFDRESVATLGGFNFKAFLKVVEPLASKAVSFIPGVGPIAATAMDLAETVVQSKSPLDALGKVAQSVAKTANLPDVLQSSDYAHAWMLATQSGLIKDPRVPAPAGLAYHPHAVPNRGPIVYGSAVLIPAGAS